MSSKHVMPKRRADPEFWTVNNELPDPIPISNAELDAIEGYFSDLLDAVFAPKPRANSGATAAYKKGNKR